MFFPAMVGVETIVDGIQVFDPGSKNKATHHLHVSLRTLPSLCDIFWYVNVIKGRLTRSWFPHCIQTSPLPIITIVKLYFNPMEAHELLHTRTNAQKQYVIVRFRHSGVVSRQNGNTYSLTYNYREAGRHLNFNTSL